MATQPKHGLLRPDVNGIHVPYSYSYVDATFRLAATGFVPDDLYKICIQLDDNSVWMLTAVTPVWVQVGGNPTLSVVDHGTATGLVDDDHLQYALLTGRSTGQTLTGGLAPSEPLVLQSTSDATLGAIFLRGKRIEAGEIQDNQSDGAVISGGHDNVISTFATGSTISGGYINQILGTTTDSSIASVIGGGHDNVITSSDDASIQGGRFNTIALGSGHAIIVGGSSNKVETLSGYAIISGGQSNTVQTSSSFVIISGGQSNTVEASSGYATIAGGKSNTVLTGVTPNVSLYCTIGGGLLNKVSAKYGTVVGGKGNEVSAMAGVAMGYFATATLQGEIAHSSNKFTTNGDMLIRRFCLYATTTDATPTSLGTGFNSDKLLVPLNSTWLFEASIVGRVVGGTGQSATYKVEGTIKRDGLALVTLLGVPTVTTIYEDIVGWDVVVSVDVVNSLLNIQVVGAIATNIRWVASLRVTQVGG